MARFIGTPEEFYDLFGSNLLTNAVSAYTKEYREKMVGVCQAKGTDDIECSKELEAAHNHENGFSRKSIAMKILQKYANENGIVDVEFEQFLKEFYEEHKPFHRSIRILCSKHHGAFDKGKREKRGKIYDTIYGMPKEKPIAKGKYTIEFLPNEEAIIDKLKSSGTCYIHYYFADGNIVTKVWHNARKEITKDNLRPNIQGKTFLRDFRPRIEKVEVSVLDKPGE